MSAAFPQGISLSATPSPWDQPKLWDNLILTLPNGGQVTLPGKAGEGRVVVSVEASAKVNQKQASGSGTGKTSVQRAQKSETTVESIEPATVKIYLAWTYRAHVETEQGLFLINPNGPNGGQPLDIRHPETDANAVSHIMITKFGATKRDGGLYIKEIEATEWNPPPPAAEGDGADTPDENDSSSYSATFAAPAGKSVVAQGTPQGPASAFHDTGFDGPNAPKAKP